MRKVELLEAKVAEEQKKQNAKWRARFRKSRRPLRTPTRKIGEVKSDVSGVQDRPGRDQGGIDKTISELKRVARDMGEMSGLIANQRQGVERAHRQRRPHLRLSRPLQEDESSAEARRHRDSAKEDRPRQGRYSLDVIADDKKPVEKRDKGINEPVAVLCRLEVEPGYELVVNRWGRTRSRATSRCPRSRRRARSHFSPAGLRARSAMSCRTLSASAAFGESSRYLFRCWMAPWRSPLAASSVPSRFSARGISWLASSSTARRALSPPRQVVR